NFDPSKGPVSNGQVASTNLQANVTSHTVTSADFTVPGYAFDKTHNYEVEIGLIQTKDGTGNLNNSNLQAISRVYADFTPVEGGGPAINLPVALESGAYKFNITVVPGQTYYIDPAVAIGYDYQIGEGNPTFLSVVLPAGIGDGLYNIIGFDAAGHQVVLA